MKLKSNVYDAGTIVMLTVEGRLALVADALATAHNTRNEDEEHRKRLCEKVMGYLRPVVQG